MNGREIASPLNQGDTCPNAITFTLEVRSQLFLRLYNEADETGGREEKSKVKELGKE